MHAVKGEGDAAAEQAPGVGVSCHKGHQGCIVNLGGGAVVQCSGAWVTRNGLESSESRAKRCFVHDTLCELVDAEVF